MKINKYYLLLIASIVWLIAGANVLNIGLQLYSAYISIINIILSIIIFLIFWLKVFNPLVNKHTQRITSYTILQQPIYNFFDKKSFIIMAFMITLGVVIRVFHLAPERFIAIFYSGLGSALTLAGLKFLYQFFKYRN